MMQNVQGAAPVQWPDPTALTSVAPTPAAAPARHEQHEPRRFDATAAQTSYDSMRLQAFRRDAADAASMSSMTPSKTATASTVSAPAVKSGPAPLVPVTPQPDVTFRAAPPQSPPSVQAPTAVDTGSSSGASRR
jgi:hypothetical protein